MSNALLLVTCTTFGLRFSISLIEQLKKAFPKNYKAMEVVALAVLEDGRIDGYDGLDKQIKSDNISKFTKIIGIE